MHSMSPRERLLSLGFETAPQEIQPPTALPSAAEVVPQQGGDSVSEPVLDSDLDLYLDLDATVSPLPGEPTQVNLHNWSEDETWSGSSDRLIRFEPPAIAE